MLTVYTTKTCSYCKMVKKYLSTKKIEFEEVDITDDKTIREQLFDKTGMMSVPVTTDGSNYVTGFQPTLLSKLI